jgi:GntR family transcriptional regulator
MMSFYIPLMNIAAPKFLNVKLLLQARMVRDMSPGDQIPSEPTLQQDFAVSRATIQQAMRLLEAEGWIRREQGRGTFYLGQPVLQMQQETSELLQTMAEKTHVIKVEVRDKGVYLPPRKVAEILGVSEGKQVAYFERLGLVNGLPLLYVYTYVPIEFGAQLLEDVDAPTQLSFALQLEQKFGMEITEVQQTISAALADPTFANALDVSIGAPVLEGERTYFSSTQQPVLFTRSFYRADRHRFVVRLKEWH